jgi:hypothetical protein
MSAYLSDARFIGAYNLTRHNQAKQILGVYGNTTLNRARKVSPAQMVLIPWAFADNRGRSHLV